jgi:hypothetical protein
VQLCHNLVRNSVSCVLHLRYFSHPTADKLPCIKKVSQRLGGFYYILSAFLKKDKEFFLLWHKGESNHGYSSSGRAIRIAAIEHWNSHCSEQDKRADFLEGGQVNSNMVWVVQNLNLIFHIA